jgi:AcrR family transcriptional regulator
MPRSPEKSKQMRAESRTQILDSAGRLFAQRGYAKTRIADVARAAGMSQGNVYWYFNSKTDLLSAVLQQGFDQVQGMLEGAARHEGSALEALQSLFDQSLILYREQLDFMRLLMATMAHSGAPYIKDLGFEMEQIGMRYHATLIPLITRAQTEGVIPSGDPNQPIMLFFSLMNGLMLTYGEDMDLVPADELRAAMMRLLNLPRDPIGRIKRSES